MYLALYDNRYLNRLSAQLSIATTFLVCIVLGAGAMIFSKMTSELVIDPIERMIQRIE